MEVDCMPVRHRSAWLRRRHRDRVARIAVSVAIPVATSMAAGVMDAIDGHDMHIDHSAVHNCLSRPTSAPGDP
jgi:hypothetical protein